MTGQDISNLSDEEIAHFVQQGEIDFFNTLISRYEKKMNNYARNFLSDKEDINDVLQEVFIKAYKNIKSFDTGRKFSSWLYRIAHNEFVNALKKRSKRPLPLFDLDVFFPQHTKEKNGLQEQIDQKDMKETVNKFLGKLDVKYKEPIILFYIEELSYKEIADVMQVPVSTVGIRIKRGKDIIKSISEKMGYNL
jgi:RNA polymerase sigma-70 factor, ECF subfamily